MTFAKCFRVTYCPDLIVRHKAATKSQTARIQGTPIDHRNQLNTIHITHKPKRNGKDPYKNSPFTKERSVLVVDDFTIEGYGLESARAYLKAIPKMKDIFLVSLGRFPNRNVYELSPLPEIKNPFAPNELSKTLPTKTHFYASGVKAKGSTKEIAEHFTAYGAWDWPK